MLFNFLVQIKSADFCCAHAKVPTNIGTVCATSMFFYAVKVVTNQDKRVHYVRLLGFGVMKVFFMGGGGYWG